MHPTLDVHTTIDADRTVVAVAGELDLDTCPDLTRATLDLVLPGRTLALDLSGVTYMDSTGLNLLLKLRERAGTEDGTLELHGVSERVRFVLDLTGTRNLFVLRPNTRAA